MRIGKIEDDKKRKEAEEARATAVGSRGRSRADYAAVQLEGVQERLNLYAAVHDSDKPTASVARAWVASVGGVKKARELA